MISAIWLPSASVSLHGSQLDSIPIFPVRQVSVRKAQAGEALSGGQTTIFNTTPNAFSQPAPGLERMDELLFFVGNSFFNQNWVTAPASTKVNMIYVPFDQAIIVGEERNKVLDAVMTLQDQGDKIAEIAAALGLTINTALPE